MKPTKEEYYAALKIVNIYKKEEEIEEMIDACFEEVCEILSSGTEEPAGHGAGYGFRTEASTDAFEVFKRFIHKIREIEY